MSETIDDESSQLIAPLQKVRSIFVSLDAIVSAIIFFKHYLVSPKPKKRGVLRGAQLHLHNISQRQSSFENQDCTRLGDVPGSNHIYHRDSGLSENVETESQHTNNDRPSNSMIAKAKASFCRKESIESDAAENGPRHSSLASIDEEHNGENVHPHSSIIDKVKAPFHRKESIESDADEGPCVAHLRRNSLGSIKEEHSGEDLHPVRLHVVNGNETFNLPKWILREYATEVQTENALLLDPMVEEA